MKTHNTHGVKLPTKDLSAEEIKPFNKLLKKGIASEKKHHAQFLKAYEHYTEKPSGKSLKAVRREVDKYLGSQLIRFVAVVKANKKLAVADRLSIQECWSLANNLRFHMPLTEPVKVYTKAKAHGGKRPISVFGIGRKAVQLLVRSLLDHRLKPRAWQYTHRGVHKAIEYIVKLNPSADVNVRKLDIVNQFGNFQEVQLREFCKELPKDVVRIGILSNTYPLTSMDGSPIAEETSYQARQGIAQGSAVSPLVAALSVAQLDWTPPEGVHLLNSADDFLLICDDLEKLDKATSALTAAVAALPGGNFSLVPKNMLVVGNSTSTFGKGVTFLGHYIQRWEDGTLAISPCDSAYARFGDVTERILSDIATHTQKHQKLLEKEDYEGMAEVRSRIVYRIAELNKYVGGWRSAFSMCQPVFIDEVTAAVGHSAYAICQKFDITLDDLKDVEVIAPEGSTYSSGADYHLAELNAA